MRRHWSRVDRIKFLQGLALQIDLRVSSGGGLLPSCNGHQFSQIKGFCKKQLTWGIIHEFFGSFSTGHKDPLDRGKLLPRPFQKIRPNLPIWKPVIGDENVNHVRLQSLASGGKTYGRVDFMTEQAERSGKRTCDQSVIFDNQKLH
jgi:hypothetical protein